MSERGFKSPRRSADHVPHQSPAPLSDSCKAPPQPDRRRRRTSPLRRWAGQGLISLDEGLLSSEVQHLYGAWQNSSGACPVLPRRIPARMSSSRKRAAPTSEQLIPWSSSASALARRARRCSTKPFRANSISSARSVVLKNPAQIMPTTGILSKGFCKIFSLSQ